MKRNLNILLWIVLGLFMIYGLTMATTTAVSYLTRPVPKSTIGAFR